MKLRAFFSKTVLILSPEQKQRFKEYLPQKVYKAERNVVILVAVMQVCMIALSLSRGLSALNRPRSVGYLSLYTSLLLVTGVVLWLYRYMVKGKHYTGFFYVRRLYALMLCVWVVGLSFLEQMNGGGLTVFCYLLPTAAAVVLLSPMESTVLFGLAWVGLVVMLLTFGVSGGHFGDIVNSLFVTVLALFISFRSYRSMAIEFRDREIIESQYAEIMQNNNLLGQLAHVDQLTGLYNRHYLHQNVSPEFLRCQENGNFAMCLMLDLDYFKQYNDLYGHLQGDECLRRMGQIICAICKQQDITAIRYGGEEFLLLKLYQKPFDAGALAEKLMQSIKEANLPRSDVPQQRVTASIGLWYGNLRDIADMEFAIQCADDGLYGAKTMGRDRIVLGGPASQ